MTENEFRTGKDIYNGIADDKSYNNDNVCDLIHSAPFLSLLLSLVSVSIVKLFYAVFRKQYRTLSKISLA